MSGTAFLLPENRAALIIRGSGFDTLAALNSVSDPWISEIRSVLTSRSAQRHGTINDVPHLWVGLQVAPPISDRAAPGPGIEIAPPGDEILLTDDLADEWTRTIKTGKSIPASPIRKNSLDHFIQWVHERAEVQQQQKPISEEHPAATEENRPIIDDEAIDRADAHAIASVLRLNRLNVPDDFESLPIDKARALAKQITRSPEARTAAEALREEERRAKEKRTERDRYPSFARRSDKGVRLDNAAVGAYIRERLHALTFNQRLFIYDRTTGLYVEDAGQVGSLIQEIAEVVEFNGSITSAKREIMSYIRDHNIAPEYPFDHYPNALPLANGVLEINWDTEIATLCPYSPEHRFTQKWPATFDASADPKPIHEVLRQYVDDEEVFALLQLPAQAILHFCGFGPFKRSYIFEGPSNGGKSTYLVDLLNRLFGAENISGASLQAIGRDRFVTSSIGSAVINRCDDLSDVPVENVGPFKALTGSFSHDIEKKFQTPYRSRVTAVHAFSTNAPPTVPDNVLFDAAFWSRWVYLRFNNVFEVDPGFVSRTFTPAAIAGLFNEVLKVAFEIRRNGRLLYEQDPGEVRAVWQSAANPFQKFVSEEMLSTQNPTLFEKGQLLRAFRAWCGANDINPRKLPSTITGFTQMIYASGFTTTRRGSKNEQEWKYEARYTWKANSRYQKSAEGIGSI
ncbi:DUF5906 domain-containing protein [Methanofollis ethanolicus]|uniref:DUF5906 domain-containing protein n=1 Tax=Methanofollis ethanolicus TaxID=488124 RepID=UPI00083017F0|nr:DUF5906 domain-containing protein [Methanofollis ethanolicus]